MSGRHAMGFPPGILPTCARNLERRIKNHEAWSRLPAGLVRRTHCTAGLAARHPARWPRPHPSRWIPEIDSSESGAASRPVSETTAVETTVREHFGIRELQCALSRTDWAVDRPPSFGNREQTVFRCTPERSEKRVDLRRFQKTVAIRGRDPKCDDRLQFACEGAASKGLCRRGSRILHRVQSTAGSGRERDRPDSRSTAADNRQTLRRNSYAYSAPSPRTHFDGNLVFRRVRVFPSKCPID